MNLSITQALAYGLPVVATQHSGFPDQVHDGESGYLVPEGDYKLLAERIAYLVEHEELWERFGKEGRKIAEMSYDSVGLMDMQVSIYEKVISESKMHSLRSG